jgi:GGDEF domain-containing protein
VHPVGPLLARAYTGRVASQVADKGDGPILQVFVPLGRAGTGGVVEVDLPHDATSDRTHAAVLTLAVLLSAGLALLWALLWWLSRLVTRALRRTALEQEELARTDALTGLPNRRALLLAVDEAYAAATPCALLVLDLDRFQAVNSTLGHAVGDRLLTEVGLRLRGGVREQDVVARLGGDEFAVLLPGCSTVARQASGTGCCGARAARRSRRAAAVLQATAAWRWRPGTADCASAMLQRAEVFSPCTPRKEAKAAGRLR